MAGKKLFRIKSCWKIQVRQYWRVWLHSVKKMSNAKETFRFKNFRTVDGRIFTLDIYEGFSFLRKLVPVVKMNKKWRYNFNGNTFFSHCKKKLLGVLIPYIGTHIFVVNNQKTDNEGRILILDVVFVLKIQKPNKFLFWIVYPHFSKMFTLL